MEQCAFKPKIIPYRFNGEHSNLHKTCGEIKSQKEIDNEIQCTFKPKINDKPIKLGDNIPLGYEENINRIRCSYQQKLQNIEKQK